MYLYIIENCDTGQVKIGYSQCPRSRCSSLQTGSSAQLQLVHTVSVSPSRARILENKLHHELSHYRARGEWFNLSASSAKLMLDHCVIRWHDDILI